LRLFRECVWSIPIELDDRVPRDGRLGSGMVYIVCVFDALDVVKAINRLVE